MAYSAAGNIVSAVFITFAGNCRKALTHYQACFGGVLQFNLFTETLLDHPEPPVVNGSLVSDRIIIHGSDMVHNEGRTLGNYMSIFLHCKNASDRKALAGKLESDGKHRATVHDSGQKLVEITDRFDVRWVLGI